MYIHVVITENDIKKILGGRGILLPDCRDIEISNAYPEYDIGKVYAVISIKCIEKPEL